VVDRESPEKWKSARSGDVNSQSGMKYKELPAIAVGTDRLFGVKKQ
jgi:hypothetical protein